MEQYAAHSRISFVKKNIAEAFTKTPHWKMPPVLPRAVPILTPRKGSTNSYYFDENALRAIVDKPEIAGKPVAIVSVAGAFRKGKSFLLNFFVHYLEWLERGCDTADWFSKESVLDKFHFRGGCERDTQGIQMWSHPFMFMLDGRATVILLMDTQGTFDSRTTMKECATVFALSTMLSSLQIFNISQNIQEDDLQHLQLFAEYGRLANQYGSEKAFQNLIFLLRDWPNSFEYEYGFEGGQQYLDTVLTVTSEQARELKSLRKELKECFDNMSCFTMPHPGLRIARNQSETTVGDVEPEFEEHMNVFVPAVFGRELPAKKIAGRLICCSEFVRYFKAYVDVFRGDSLPEPSSIYQATAEAVLMTVVAKSKELYEQGIRKIVHGPPPLIDVNVLAEHHRYYKTRAVQLFEQTPKLGGKELSGQHLANLQRNIDGYYREQLKTVMEQQKQKEREKYLDDREKQRQAEHKKAQEDLALRDKEREEKSKREREELERKRKEMDEENRRQQETHRKAMEEQDRQHQLELQRERQRRETMQWNPFEAMQLNMLMRQMCLGSGGGYGGYGGGYGGGYDGGYGGGGSNHAESGGGGNSSPRPSSGHSGVYWDGRDTVRRYRDSATGRFTTRPE